MFVAALRRFLVLLALVAAGTAAISLVLGTLAGAAVGRSVSVGFYLVGCFLLLAGFFVGNRGPVRLKQEVGVPFFGSRFMRWATPAEREDQLNTSAIFVVMGLALILLGIAADSRNALF